MPAEEIRILLIGDVFGRAGRRLLKRRLPALRREKGVDLVVANGENAAGHAGITPEVAEELFSSGVDVITLGDHAWDRREILPVMGRMGRLIRPANYPPGCPGSGWTVVRVRGVRVAVISLLGRVFFSLHPDCPFRTADRLLEELRPEADLFVLDFHAEATSEKVALGWHLAGRVQAVVGTHTHVQTADASILPGGTAYVTDLGLTGPAEGVIGLDRETALRVFLTQMPAKFEPARGRVQLQGALVTLDPPGRRASGIEMLRELWEEED